MIYLHEFFFCVKYVCSTPLILCFLRRPKRLIAHGVSSFVITIIAFERFGLIKTVLNCPHFSQSLIICIKFPPTTSNFTRQIQIWPQLPYGWGGKLRTISYKYKWQSVVCLTGRQWLDGVRAACGRPYLCVSSRLRGRYVTAWTNISLSQGRWAPTGLPTIL